MSNNKFGRPMRAGFGGNNRHVGRRVCGGSKVRVSYRTLIRRFVYSMSEAFIAGIDLVVYGIAAFFNHFDKER